MAFRITHEIEEMIDTTMSSLVDYNLKINFEDIENINFPLDKPFGLQVKHEKMIYCLIIRFSSNNKNLICFGPGAQERNQYTQNGILKQPPFFSRWSWYEYFEESTLAYADPLLFFDDKLKISWFVCGEKWYLKSLAEIIEKIAKHRKILNSNILFFGSSGGGYTSVVLGTFIRHSKVLINNSQLFLMNHYETFLNDDRIFDLLENDLSMKREKIIHKYDYRFNVIKLFQKEKYAPHITYHLNVVSDGDVLKQGLPFMKEMCNCQYFNGLDLCLYAEFKETPHEPMHGNIGIKIIKEYCKINLYNLLDNYDSLDGFNIKGLNTELNLYDILEDNSKNDDIDTYNLLRYKNILSKYLTARIDIKNFGRGNSVKILEKSDEELFVEYPKWFSVDNNGEGMVIYSKKGELDLKIKCYGDGEILIRFMAKDIRNNEGSRCPCYINYTNISINGEKINKLTELVWHDNPVSFKKPVKDGDIIDIFTLWKPF